MIFGTELVWGRNSGLGTQQNEARDSVRLHYAPLSPSLFSGTDFVPPPSPINGWWFIFNEGKAKFVDWQDQLSMSKPIPPTGIFEPIEVS